MCHDDIDWSCTKAIEVTIHDLTYRGSAYLIDDT